MFQRQIGDGAFFVRVSRAVHGGIVDNHELLVGSQADVELKGADA